MAEQPGGPDNETNLFNEVFITDGAAQLCALLDDMAAKEMPNADGIFRMASPAPGDDGRIVEISRFYPETTESRFSARGLLRALRFGHKAPKAAEPALPDSYDISFADSGIVTVVKVSRQVAMIPTRVTVESLSSRDDRPSLQRVQGEEARAAVAKANSLVTNGQPVSDETLELLAEMAQA